MVFVIASVLRANPNLRTPVLGHQSDCQTAVLTSRSAASPQCRGAFPDRPRRSIYAVLSAQGRGNVTTQKPFIISLDAMRLQPATRGRLTRRSELTASPALLLSASAHRRTARRQEARTVFGHISFELQMLPLVITNPPWLQAPDKAHPWQYLSILRGGVYNIPGHEAAHHHPPSRTPISIPDHRAIRGTPSSSLARAKRRPRGVRTLATALHQV